MGMESFFVIILPDGISHKKGEYNVNKYEGNSNLTMELFKRNLSDVPYKFNVINEDEITIENKYLMKLWLEDKKIKVIEIESCLYYLMNDDEVLKELLLHATKSGLRLFYPGIGYFENVVDYLVNLKIFYKAKYDNFMFKYEYLFRNKNILPGNNFYKFLS